MVDPEVGLISFQKAILEKLISPAKGNLHKDILFYSDAPYDQFRLTYALLKNEEIVAIAQFAPAEPYKKTLCHNLGYAVDSKHRCKGYGKEVIQKAFDELVNSYKTSGMAKDLYIEALVALDNIPSNKLARRLLSTNFNETIDHESGDPALQYFRKLM